MTSPMTPTTPFTYRTTDCGSCDGTRHCDECEGRGELDASCAECRAGLPLNDDGLCERCADACTLPLSAFNEKWVPLTECHGDPMLGRKAA
jgi:RecJ-like exonuclease